MYSNLWYQKLLLDWVTAEQVKNITNHYRGEELRDFWVSLAETLKRNLILRVGMVVSIDSEVKFSKKILHSIQHLANWDLLFSRKVMDQCENFKEDPMETNHAQEVNYGQRGWLDCHFQHQSNRLKASPSVITTRVKCVHYSVSHHSFFFHRAELSLTHFTAVLMKP